MLALPRQKLSPLSSNTPLNDLVHVCLGFCAGVLSMVRRHGSKKKKQLSQRGKVWPTLMMKPMWCQCLSVITQKFRKF